MKYTPISRPLRREEYFMRIRLHETHPIMAHWPVVLIPTMVGLDIAAHVTDDDRLHRIARITTPAVAGCTALTAATGLIAEQEVRTDDESQSMLDAHRNVNLISGGVLTAMAAYRSTGRRPGWGYMATGVGLVGALAYSAYLGGRMVYEKGVGVEAAGGLRTDQSPTIGRDTIGQLLTAAGRQLWQGIRNLFRSPLDISVDETDLQRAIDAEPAGADIGPVPRGP